MNLNFVVLIVAACAVIVALSYRPNSLSYTEWPWRIHNAIPLLRDSPDPGKSGRSEVAPRENLHQEN